jgi:hypothetical protein
MPEPQEQPKLSGEELKLDKFKQALSTLSEQVGDFSSAKEAFYKDVKKELKISTEKTDALWEQVINSEKWQEVIRKKALGSVEKAELDAIVEDAENYDVIKDAIEKASGDIGVIKKLLSSLEDKWNKSKFSKTIKWGALTAWFGKYFIEFANSGLKKLEDAKAKGFSFTGIWKTPILEKIKGLGRWFSGVNKMEKQMKTAFDSNKYDEAKRLAAEIQKIEPENKAAKKYLAEMKKPKPPAAPVAISTTTATTSTVEAAPTAGVVIPEIVQETSSDELNNILGQNNIKLAANEVDYKKFLENKGYSADHFNGMASEALKKDGAIGIINETFEIHGNLQKTFKYKLEDFLIEKKDAKHIAQAISGSDDTYQIPDFQNLTSTKFRHFLNAVHIGDESLNQYLA